MYVKPKTIDIPKGAVICECCHCGERFGSMNGTCAVTCKNCRVKEQRKIMDEQNRGIFKKLGLVFRCKFCE